jgi:carbon-monoxide dehydrogenase large subunit
VELRDGHAQVKGSDLRVSFRDIVRLVSGTPGYKLPSGVTPGMEATEQVVIDPMTYSNGTAVVEVEVDADTGGVTINRVVFVHDCGNVLNAAIVDGQVVGGIVHGVGNALFEYMQYDADAQPLTTTFADYLLVTATEAPPIELIHHTSPTPLNPLGVKGVGESGVLPMPAAIISAIEDALSPFGVRITQAPISPRETKKLISASLSGEGER